MSAGTSGASAAPAIGTTTASIAAVMTRFRPSTSATAPVNGAVKAMASALAVMMVLISAGADAEFARQCREQRLRRVQVEEGTEAGGGDGDLAGIEAHAVQSTRSR